MNSQSKIISLLLLTFFIEFVYNTVGVELRFTYRQWMIIIITRCKCKLVQFTGFCDVGQKHLAHQPLLIGQLLDCVTPGSDEIHFQILDSR